MATLYLGIVILNTNYIPKLLSKTKLNAVTTYPIELNNGIHTISPIPLELLIGGSRYMLDAGEHYIPQIHTFHQVHLATDVSGRDDIEIHHECVVDNHYFDFYTTFLSYGIVINSLRYSHLESKDTTIFKAGMCGHMPFNEITRLIPKNTGDLLWLSTRKVIDDPNIIPTYSCFIYHNDIKTTQRDPEVTKWLLAYDRYGVRSSNPPCIAITYNEPNYEPLREVLERKYGIFIESPKTKRANTVFKNVEYVEMVDEINRHNAIMQLAQDAGILSMHVCRELIVTESVYEHILNTRSLSYP